MALMLHAGARETDYAHLRRLGTPPATATHVPLPHFRLVDLVTHALARRGHEVRERHHAITPDGLRYFGVLTIRSPHAGYEDVVGLRNSHDKSLPVGVAFGSRVFVCDNAAFVADHVIRAKHTARLESRLPGLVGGLIESLAGRRQAQARCFERYRATDLTEAEADHAIMGMYREGVIPVTKIADVWREWEEPTFEEFAARRDAWRLFNAATFVLAGRAAENPAATIRLHRIIDAACGRLSHPGSVPDPA